MDRVLLQYQCCSFSWYPGLQSSVPKAIPTIPSFLPHDETKAQNKLGVLKLSCINSRKLVSVQILLSMRQMWIQLWCSPSKASGWRAGAYAAPLASARSRPPHKNLGCCICVDQHNGLHQGGTYVQCPNTLKFKISLGDFWHYLLGTPRGKNPEERILKKNLPPLFNWQLCK